MQHNLDKNRWDSARCAPKKSLRPAHLPSWGNKQEFSQRPASRPIFQMRAELGCEPRFQGSSDRGPFFPSLAKGVLLAVELQLAPME